jgi:hypothetical protein
MNDEFLVTFGSEVKASPNGRFTGYLVRFSSADAPDLAGEFFTKDTDFGIVNGQKTPVFFNHRLPITTRSGSQIIVKQKIGEGSMMMDEMGVMLDAIIWNRDNYEKAIIEAGRKNILGWSSGTAPHLVDYEPAGKSRFIKSWPLGLDASLTPMPCEPLNNAMSLRSYSQALSAMKFAPIDLTSSPEDADDDDFDDKPASEVEKLVSSFKSLDVETHSRLAVSAVKDIASRFRSRYEARLKDKRSVSEPYRQHVVSVMEQCKAASAELELLINEAAARTNEAGKRATETEYLMRKYRYDRR